MDTQDPHRGNLSYHPTASPGEEAATTLPSPAPASLLFQSDAISTCDLVSFAKEVKRMAVASEDIEGLQQISMPMSLPSSDV